MIPPSNCPYKGLTATPCWNCPQYIPDTDQCMLNPFRVKTSAATQYVAQTYDERMHRYEEDRRKLLELSKEALVDLILHKPTMF